MPSATVAELKRMLVFANRLLVHFDVLDGFGHVSARHPDRADRFLLARRVAPALVTEDDIVEFGLDSEPVDDPATPAFLERFIHGAIYAARPDIGSVVHSHSPAMVGASVVRDLPFRPVCHTCGFLHDGAPLFEIRDVAGEATNLLISSRELGDALARSLGDAHVVLMRGHGSTATGSSLPHAVYRAVYSEVNAKLRAQAAPLGDVISLTPDEALAAEETADLQVERTWAYWKNLKLA